MWPPAAGRGAFALAELVGPYRIERSRIWHGRWYRAGVDTRTGTPVYLISTTCTDREAAHAELAHPNLPPVVDVYDDGAATFVVLASPQGQPLLESPPSDASAAWGCAWAVLQALAHLHTRAVPIFLAGFGPGALTLGDTPILNYPAWLLEGGEWVHPGQIGLGPGDLDLFSTGALLHRLLTGKSPLEAPLLFQPLTDFPLHLDPGLLRTAQRALNLTLQPRGSDAAHVVAELQPYVREMTLLQSPGMGRIALAPEAAPVAARSSRRWLAVFGDLALFVACLFLGLWIASAGR